jgi:biopolymer transport protein ExbB
VVLPALEWMDGGPDAVSEALAAQMQRKQKELNRGMTFLGTLGNNAPFIGLFGTVIGVVQAFEALGKHGNSAAQTASTMAPQAVMASIAEALVATAMGLAVAIPAVAMYNVFQRRAKAILANTEALSRVLIAHLVGEEELAPVGAED